MLDKSKMLAPNNSRDMQSQQAKNSIHPLTSWPLFGGEREKIYLFYLTDLA